MSAIEDPTKKVRRKPKKDSAKMGRMTGMPEFSAPDYSAVEKTQLGNMGNEIGPELEYLQRLHLRSKISRHETYAKYVPPPSDRELAIGEWLAYLNQMSQSADPSVRRDLELLYARFNSRSLWNISCELASMRLAQASVRQIEELVKNGPTGMVNVMVQGEATKAAERAAYAAPHRV